MLKIFLGNMGGVIYHPPTYFDNQYEDEWITDPLTKEMVKDVDQSEVISSRLIDSPVLGPVSVKELSGGVKTLILLAFDKNQKIFAKWILEIGKKKDLTVNLRHVMNFGDGKFEIEILNTGEIVYDMEKFAEIAGKYV